jgi:hypothetical protein
MSDNLYQRLQELHTKACELCYAIEELPASERETETVMKASDTVKAIQDWLLSEKPREKQ